MQPYFFPYIGYFALLEKADCFVIADDLNYIKNGFINKNYILSNKESFRMSLQLKKASQNKLINEIDRGDNLIQILETIKRAYVKAPYYNEVFPVIEKILSNTECNLARFLGDAIKDISDFLKLDVDILYSSEIQKNQELRFDERILDICHRLGAEHYVNSIGGQELYDKKKFADHGVKLNFIECPSVTYQQFSEEFIPSLSIIDVMMFNSVSKIREILKQCQLI